MIGGCQRVLFIRVAFRNGKDVIFERPVGSVGEETIVREPEGPHAHPTGMAADGQYLIYEGEEDATDVWGLQLTGDRKAHAYVQSMSFETQGTLSADGRLLAYTSDVSGRFEVYVQRFPEPGPRIQVSVSGGTAARWRRDGKELFYLALDGTLMAVPVRPGPPLEFGSPVTLFQFLASYRGLPTQSQLSYDVTADGQRFIVSAVARRTDPSINVLLNWPSLVASSTP